jgi:hypothetical protein
MPRSIVKLLCGCQAATSRLDPGWKINNITAGARSPGVQPLARSGVWLVVASTAITAYMAAPIVQFISLNLLGALIACHNVFQLSYQNHHGLSSSDHLW